MTTPDRTVASLDDYRTDVGSLLRRLHTHADRLALMVDVTYVSGPQTHWVTASNPLAEQPAVQVERDTVEAAMTAALQEMEDL